MELAGGEPRRGTVLVRRPWLLFAFVNGCLGDALPACTTHIPPVDQYSATDDEVKDCVAVCLHVDDDHLDCLTPDGDKGCVQACVLSAANGYDWPTQCEVTAADCPAVLACLRH